MQRTARRQARTQADLGRGRKRLRLVVLASVTLVGLLLVLFLGRFFEIQHLRHETLTLHQETVLALDRQSQLRDRLAQADDPVIVEDLAREWFGWVRPGEEKIIFIGED